MIRLDPFYGSGRQTFIWIVGYRHFGAGGRWKGVGRGRWGLRGALDGGKMKLAGKLPTGARTKRWSRDMDQQSPQAELADTDSQNSEPKGTESTDTESTDSGSTGQSEPATDLESFEAAMNPWLKRLERWGIRLGIAFVVGLILFVAVIRWLNEPLPELKPSPEADQLARQMMAAVQVDAWHSVGAVSWNFGDRRQHLWDRQRQLARVIWEDNLVLLDLETQLGVAVTLDGEVRGPERSRLEKIAWSHWCNDSFWLNPIAKLFDEGTSRGLVEVDGETALLVRYDSGGVTPGDAYLWFVGSDGKPTRWKMWTSILPFGGVEATWEDWMTLGNGALISTRHKTKLFELELTEIVAGPNLRMMAPKGDPFAPLIERRPELAFRYQQAQEAKIKPFAQGPEPVLNVSLGEVIRKAAGAEKPAED